jgi:hypothetical protein
VFAVAPAWLMWEMLVYQRLHGDDFVVAAGSRTWSKLVDHLWMPHHAFVIPLFRLWTFILLLLAGDLAHLQVVLAWASYLTLLLAMALTGILVVRETGNVALGLGVMAVFGLSTVVEPSVVSYAASATLGAGVVILEMLIALQIWRKSGGIVGLGLAALMAALAPWVWPGGYAAGPVGAAYLLADGRARCLKVAVVPVLAVALTALISWTLERSAPFPPERQGGPSESLRNAIDPVRGAMATAQAIPEVLICRNLGLVVKTRLSQALVLCGGLAAAWALSRGGSLRPNPLEAAGAVLVVAGFWMAYSAPGSFAFEDLHRLQGPETFASDPSDGLRSLAWAYTLPQIGALLFAAGWWSSRQTSRTVESSALDRPSWGEWLTVLALTAVLATVHFARATAILEASVYPITASELKKLPVPHLQRLRAVALAELESVRQEHYLAQLDRLERACALQGIDGPTLRRVFGRVVGPGFPRDRADFDVVSLLNLPDRGTLTDEFRVAAAVGHLLRIEPERRPPWVGPSEPWPPQVTDDRGGDLNLPDVPR